MQSHVSLLPIICSFHVTLPLVNVVSQGTLPIWETLLLVSLMVSNKNSYFTMACRAFYA